jgi:hypothetical protein
MSVIANNAQPLPRRGQRPSIRAAHRQVARRAWREARIYDGQGRRKRGTVRGG